VTGSTWMHVTAVSASTIPALVAAGAATGGAEACTPGVRQVNGGLARVFCRPATATAVLAGRKLVFKNGQCDRTKAYLTINLGTTALDLKVKPKPDSFGITVGRTPLTPSSPPAGKDGVYTAGVITFVQGGKGSTLRAGARLVLKDGRTAGTFSGTAEAGRRATGSFRC
jgi:hypothetical protein